MGLDTTHGAWNGAYSAFNLFREKIAECYGIPLSLMEGFYAADGMLNPLSMVSLACKDNPFGADRQLNDLKKYLPLKWDAFKPSAIHELLYHSDCDGDISPESCKLIADELAEVIEYAEKNTPDDLWFINRLRKFQVGCLDAWTRGERLEFR